MASGGGAGQEWSMSKVAKTVALGFRSLKVQNKKFGSILSQSL